MKKSKKTKSSGKTAVLPPSDLFGRIYLVGVVLLVLAVAFAIMPKAFNYVLIKLAIAQFLLFIILIIWLYQTFWKGKISIYKDPAYIPLGILIGWCIINLLSSSFMYASIREFARLLTCFLLYFIVINLVKREKDLVGIVVSVIIAFAVLSIHGVFTYIKTKNPVIISTFGNPNFFSAYLVTVLPLAILSTIYNFLRKNFLISSLLSALTIGSLFLLYILDSQGAWLALGMSLVFLVILFRKQIFKPKRRIPIFSALFVLLLVISIFSVKKMPQIKEHINKDFTTGTMDIRLKIWHGTLRMIKASPFIGWGMGTFILVYPDFRIPEYFLNPLSVNATDHAHNEILEFASEIGIVGMGIFLWFLATVFLRGIRAFYGRNLNFINIIHSGLIAGVVALFLHNLTCVNLRLEASALYFYLFLGLISAGYKFYETPKEENCFIKKLPKDKILPWILIPVAVLLGVIYTNYTIKLIMSSFHLKTAIVLRDRKKWNEAIEEYNKSIYWNKYNWKAYYRVAYAYAQIDKKEEALALYLKLKELAPDYADIHYNLGALYLRSGKLKEAQEELQRSLQLNPYEPKTHCNLGAVYMKLGEQDKAFNEYALAVGVQEQKEQIGSNTDNFAGGYIGLAEIYYSNKQWEKAAQNYEKALQSGGKHVKILIKVGNCYLHMRNFRKAKQAFEEALKQDSSLTEVKKSLEKLNKILEPGKNE